MAVGAELLPHEGFDVLIDAMSRLPSAELIVVGGPRPSELAEDSDVARLSRLAADRAVSDRVHFTGALPWERIPPLLRSADLLACPSWYQASAASVVEAMACGIPVVASDAGGMRDTVVHEVTGLLVPPRDARLLAAALRDVLDGGALRQGMGLAGRSRALACYSWQRVAAEATVCYEKAMSYSAAPKRLITAS